MILGNKIDVDNHLTQKEIVEGLSLDYIKTNHWVVIMASMLKCSNLDTVVEWVMSKAIRDEK